MGENQADLAGSRDRSTHQAALVALNKLFYEGYMISRAIYVAAQLGVAEILKDQPMDTKDIAAAVGANADALYRLLRALASVGVFTEIKQRHFALTPLAACLRTDVPGSLNAYILFYGSEFSSRPADNLLYSVRTGLPAFEQVFGMPQVAYFNQHPEVSSMFDAAMASISSLDISDVLAVFDFSGTTTIADIGGGNGAFLTAILRANPKMKGVLFDRPLVITNARSRIDAAGLVGRCDLIGGDIFDTLPGGADAYVLKNVIHDFDDTQSVGILRNCRRAMPDNGKLLVIEPALLPGDQPTLSKFVDLMMLLQVGGRERTEEEFRTLFEAGGFKLTRLIPTKSRVSIVEGVPV